MLACFTIALILLLITDSLRRATKYRKFRYQSNDVNTMRYIESIYRYMRSIDPPLKLTVFIFIFYGRCQLTTELEVEFELELR